MHAGWQMQHRSVLDVPDVNQVAMCIAIIVCVCVCVTRCVTQQQCQQQEKHCMEMLAAPAWQLLQSALL